MRINMFASTTLAAIALPLAACGQQGQYPQGQQVAYQQQIGAPIYPYVCNDGMRQWSQPQPCNVQMGGGFTFGDMMLLSMMTNHSPYYGAWHQRPVTVVHYHLDDPHFAGYRAVQQRTVVLRQSYAASKPSGYYGSATAARPLASGGTTTVTYGKVTTAPGNRIVSNSQPYRVTGTTISRPTTSGAVTSSSYSSRSYSSPSYSSRSYSSPSYSSRR